MGKMDIEFAGLFKIDTVVQLCLGNLIKTWVDWTIKLSFWLKQNYLKELNKFNRYCETEKNAAFGTIDLKKNKILKLNNNKK